MNIPCSKHFRTFLTYTLFVFSLFFISSNAFAQPDGAKLFKQNCAVCHSLGANKLTGPGLAGVATRVPQPADEWLLKWIKNNEAVRKAGDAYGNKLYQEYGGAQMTVFESLSDDEIKSIIAYFKNPPVENKTASPLPGADSNQPTADNGVDPMMILLAIIAFLAVIVFVLRGVKKNLKNVVNEKQGLPADPERSLGQSVKLWMASNKRWVAVISIVLVAWLSKISWDAMFEIGVYQGYQPEQPIKFSHKIHAGDNAINCQYCHSTVEKSKTASIPPVSTCMNCHKGIQKGPQYGETEIAKIYEAAGFNPTTQAYDKPQKPIKWVKVHNLPDFVFFSHQQHVKVGKQECKTCHGEVQEMTVAKQYAPLTMVWCIDCHRKTEVPGMKDNPYYEDLHKKLAEKFKGQPITVAKMGGIECAKCHY